MTTLLPKTGHNNVTPFEGFEAKIIMILQNEKDRARLLSLPNHNARYEFLINHFIMSDMEIRQIRSFILHYGLESFMTLFNHYLKQTLDSAGH